MNGLYDRLSNNYKELFLLIISILYGNLFFILADKIIHLFNFFNPLECSETFLYSAVFFRTFQTHILAALKYEQKWKIKPYDFLLIFLTVLFEYLLFNHHSIMHLNLYIMISIFAAFGIYGYIHTYKSYLKNAKNPTEIINEKKIQSFNILILIISILISVLAFFGGNDIVKIISNIMIASLLLINIYISLKLSDKTFD